ncbi:hypothetical protein EDB85DRAFT_766580 [Lactarius pseudohatsudake]|nr:hypothetical protein EDB85DRAFT_766580 [Lactarius pseudohatsudake]
MRHRTVCLSVCLAHSLFPMPSAHPRLTSPWTPTLTASQMARRHSKTGRAFPRLVLPLFILTPYSLPTASPLNMSRHFTTVDHFGHIAPLSLAKVRFFLLYLYC